MDDGTVATELSGDGAWRVDIERRRGDLWFAVHKRAAGGWELEDEGAMTGAWHSTWLSLIDDDDLDSDNVGLEITWAAAPEGVSRGVARVGGAEHAVRVDCGVFWLVRWQVPDPADADDEDDEVVFAAA